MTKHECIIRALIACVGEEKFLKELARIEDDGPAELAGSRTEAIEAALQDMGFPRHLNGWNAAVVGIEVILELGDSFHGDLKDVIYPQIAEATGGTVSRVEKRLRYAVERMWHDTPHRIRARYFGDAAAGGKRPPVGMFLNAAAVEAARRLDQDAKNAAVG